MARRSTRKPKPLIVGPLRARPIRCRSKTAAQDGRWYWRAELNRDGQTKTVWTGWALRDECSRMLADLVARDDLDTPRGEVIAETRTIRDLLEYWVGSQVQREDVGESWKRNSRNRGRHLVEEIGDVAIDRLSLVTLERYRDARLKKGFAPRTVNQDIKALRAAWAWGIELGFCPNRKLPTVKMVVTGVREKVTPTRDEVLRVLNELKGWP